MKLLARTLFLCFALLAGPTKAATDSLTASGSWVAPAGVTSVTIEAWGGGGAGGGNPTNTDGGGGGGGAAYSRITAVVVPGNTYTVTVGAGGAGGAGVGSDGGDSWLSTDASVLNSLVLAKGGRGGAPPIGGLGGVAGAGGAAASGIGTLKFSGGAGGTGRNSTTGRGAPGGSSAGTAANGTSGPAIWTTATAAAAPAGGGIGGNGGNANSQNGFAPATGNGGGGGGGAERNTAGGNGAGGLVIITYSVPAVISIDIADANPTAAASVSWTVTFDTNVAGLSGSNFSLANTGLGGPPAIISVTGGPSVWTVTASTGTGTGTLGLNMNNTTGVSPAITGLPFTGQAYSVRPPTPVTYYLDTTSGVNIGSDGITNVSGVNMNIPPVITALLSLANTCNGNTARSRNHPAGLYTHSRWYFNADYAIATDIGANPSGSAFLRGQNPTDTVIVSLYDYDPVSGSKALIGSSPAITLTGGGTTTAYAYTISSVIYTVPAGHRLMLEYNFNQPATNDNARVYCSTANSFIAVTETPSAVVSAPNHYELALPSGSVACLPSTVRVTACADASNPCTNPFTAASGKTALLSTSAGTLGATTVMFDAAGVASTTLSYPSAPDGTLALVTLSGEQIAAGNPRLWCPNGSACVVANSGSTTFNTAGFIFAAAAGGGVTTIPAQSAGISSAALYLRAVKTNTATQACEAALVGANAVNFAYECNNPASCYAANLMSVNGGGATTIARNNNGSVVSYLPVNMTFDAGGNAPFTFSYSDAGQVKLWATKAAGGTLLSTLSGTSNAFVVKPHHFSITNIACTVVGAGTCAPANVTGNNPAASSAAGAAFIQAGRSFKATVTAMSSAATPTPSFGKEAPAEGAELVSYNHLPGPGGASAITRVLGGFNLGASTLSDLAWNEVGVLQLRATLSNASGYLGSDVVNGKNSVVSAADPYVGRFIPDRFDTVVTAQGGGFAYSGNPAGPVPGQPFSVAVTAKNALASPTSNYNNAGGYARNINLSAPVGGGSGQLYVDALAGGAGAVPASKFLNLNPGEGKVNFSDATGKISFVFNALPQAVLAVQIHAEDADSVSSAGTNGTISIRHGRLRLFNAYGSDKADLSLPLRAEYWTGNSWTPNGDDSVTAVPATAMALSGYTGTLSAANLGASHITGTTLVAGQGSIVLTKPVPVATGSVDVAINLGTGASDQSCLSVHPATAGAAIPWLRSIYGSCTVTYDRDPSARGSFGVYAPETRKTIHVRELY